MSQKQVFVRPILDANTDGWAVDVYDGRSRWKTTEHCHQRGTEKFGKRMSKAEARGERERSGPKMRDLLIGGCE